MATVQNRLNSSRYRTPNWRMWRNIPSAELWVIVALSLNIDPYDLKAKEWSYLVLDPVLADEFSLRLHVAAENDTQWILVKRLTPAFLIQDPNYVFKETSKRITCFADFAELARKADWELPEEFPQEIFAESPQETSDATNTDRKKRGAARWADAFSQIDRMTKKTRGGLSKEKALEKLFNDNHPSVQKCKNFESYKRSYLDAEKKYKFANA